jgi:hypothetical protein
VDLLGYSVSVDGDNMFLGALGDQDLGLGAGAVFVFSASGQDCPTLTADARVVSLSSGSPQSLSIGPGPGLAGQLYFLGGSISGVAPGFTISGVSVPLNPDGYSTFLLRNPGVPPLLNNFGVLDAAGTASAQFALPAGSDAALISLEVHHAFGVLDAATGTVSFASNPKAVRIVP